MPVDLALTYNEDQNLGVGIPYTRAAEFRVAYHPNIHWAMGVGIEDPDQFVGGYVALPSAFISIGSQFDNGAQIGAANRFPDLLSKVTYDHDFGARHFHAEITGLFTGAHASVMPTGSNSFKAHSVVGGGGEIAANYALLPKLAVLANAFWSDGGAHYLVATGPQLVVRPDTAGADVSLSMVHAGAASAGLEWRRSRFITREIIMEGISSPTQRILRIRAPSLGMAGRGLPIRTTGLFSRQPSTGYRLSGVIQHTERCRPTCSTLT